jgi:hypothetical protein
LNYLLWEARRLAATTKAGRTVNPAETPPLQD